MMHLQKNQKGMYVPHIMPEPSAFQYISVPSAVQDVLPHGCGYTAGHLVSDCLAMFKGASAQGRLHQIVKAWQGNAIATGDIPTRAKQQAVEYFRFFRRFPRSPLFHDILEETQGDPVAATDAFLQMLDAQVQASGGGSSASGLASAFGNMAGADGINIPFMPAKSGGQGAGKGHPGLIARSFRVSELLKKLKLEYSFASRRGYRTQEVPYPDEELEYAPMRSWGDITRLATYQHTLPDDVFYSRLVKKELQAVRYYERIHQPRRFTMLVDVSGSMEEKLSDGYSRAEYALASAISLLQNALKGANKACIRLFDDNPYDPIEGTPENIVQELLECPFSGGGTSIDTALQSADEDSPDEIILITDGCDTVQYMPSVPLSVYQCGGEENEGLKKITKNYKEVI